MNMQPDERRSQKKQQSKKKKPLHDSSETFLPELRDYREESVTVSSVSHHSPANAAVAITQTQEITQIAALAALTRAEVQTPRWRILPEDPWLTASVLLAYIASMASFWYFYQTHQLILYGDAYAHMLITRRVFDSVTPGLAQFGGVWLPLPHILMLPFIWINSLWRTGLAGSIPSMICYLIAVCYLFLTVRRLTHNSRASFIGVLVFILNPNVLYIQTTALTEPVLIVTLTAASYYFLAWVQDDQLYYLIFAGVATFLATLARYDGWFLYVTFLLMMIPIGILKKQSREQIEGNLLTYGTIGGLGILLWCIWCWLIFGNPLYFQDGPFSSQAMQQALLQSHVLFTYHNLWQSIRYYTIDSIANVGLIVFVLAIIAVLVFVWRRRLTPEMLAGLSFLCPFPFYVIALFGGQAAIYVPGAVPPNFAHQIYNARYGVEMVVPCAIFIAVLASNLMPAHFSLRWLGTAGQVALVAVVLAQAVLTSVTGVVSLQDGQFGLDCAHPHELIIYLAQHYNNGMILEDLYSTKIDALNPQDNIDFKKIIYEGSGNLWQAALANPTGMVDWVIANPSDPHDVVAQRLGNTLATKFTRVLEESNGLSLYYRNGLSFPTRPIPVSLLQENSSCVNPGPSISENSIMTSGGRIA